MKITFYHKNVSEAEDLWTKILTLTLISFHLSFGYMSCYLKNYLRMTVYGVSFFSCFLFLLRYLMTGVPFLRAGSRPSGSHLPLTCKLRKPGNVSSNLGAAGVLRTCFSLSSPPSWFQRQAAAAELSSASMEAARRSECRGNRLSRRQFFVWCWFCSLVCLIFLLPKSNKGGD